MQIALKRLSLTDLTLFEAQFRKRPQSKQKGVNMNKNPTTSVFFPTLLSHLVTLDSAEKNKRAIAKKVGTRLQRPDHSGVPVKLTVSGPEAAPPVLWPRHISLNAKNLRLNGKLIPAPANHPQRFDDLVKGDIAIMAFEGDALPTALHLVLLTPRNQADLPLWVNADTFVGRAEGGMRTYSPQDFASLSPRVAVTHPGISLLRTPVSENEMVEAILGDPNAQAKLRAPGVHRIVTETELERARLRAAEIGRKGEFLVNRWLEEEQASYQIARFDWASATNTYSPYDFETEDNQGSIERHDVKTTTAGFGSRFFLSIGELMECSSSPNPYYIIRIWEAESGQPKMRRSDDLRPWASGISATIASLPGGVQAEGLSVDPASVTWAPATVGLPPHPDHEP